MVALDLLSIGHDSQGRHFESSPNCLVKCEKIYHIQIFL